MPIYTCHTIPDVRYLSRRDLTISNTMSIGLIKLLALSIGFRFQFLWTIWLREGVLGAEMLAYNLQLKSSQTLKRGEGISVNNYMSYRRK